MMIQKREIYELYDNRCFYSVAITLTKSLALNENSVALFSMRHINF